MKIFKAVISVLAAAAMVVAFTACGVGSGAASLQDIYKKLTASDSDYSQWKSSFASTTFEESLNGDSIVVSASGKEGLNGEYTFTLDGDYIVNEAEEGDYSSYSILMMIRSAVADLYGMNSFLMSGYLAGLENFDKENTYLFTEETDGKVITKLYAAGKWKMDGLDEMYVNDKAVQYYDGSSDSYYVNSGKITAAAINSPGHLNVFVGEYGDENTELTLKSVVTLVNKLQPDGFDTCIHRKKQTDVNAAFCILTYISVYS